MKYVMMKFLRGIVFRMGSLVKTLHGGHMPGMHVHSHPCLQFLTFGERSTRGQELEKFPQRKKNPSRCGDFLWTATKYVSHANVPSWLISKASSQVRHCPGNQTTKKSRNASSSAHKIPAFSYPAIPQPNLWGRRRCSGVNSALHLFSSRILAPTTTRTLTEADQG